MNGTSNISRSENEGLDKCNNTWNEIEAGDVRDGKWKLRFQFSHYSVVTFQYLYFDVFFHFFFKPCVCINEILWIFLLGCIYCSLNIAWQSLSFLCWFLVIGIVLAVLYLLGMLAEEPEPKDKPSRKTGATFKQLVDGNRVHFCDGQSARSSEPAGPRTGVPLLFVISFFCLAFPLMVLYCCFHNFGVRKFVS